MLSKITCNEIEKRFGNQLRYPSDCEALAGHITLATKQRISPSTLKRIFGFVKGTKEPRLYTLDVIAQYLGYENWDKYYSEFSNTENSDFLNYEEVNIRNLAKNTIIEFTYEPGRKVIMKYKGNFVFEVTESYKSKLQKSDVLKILNIIKHYPLLINSVVRNGADIGRFIAGKVSGVTGINIIK